VHLDERVTITTPEGVTVELVLAGLGSRFMATLLDAVIQSVLIVVLTLGGAAAEAASMGVVVAFAVVTTFLVLFAYALVFELLDSGRTPGKRAAGIRVVGAGGAPVGFLASATRNLLRIVDFLPLFYVVGSIAIVVTRDNRRLGDLAAGTLVVRERFGGRGADSTLVAPLTVSADQVATWDVSAVDGEELDAVQLFLNRRLQLPHAIRSHFALELVRRLWPKVSGLPQQAHPEYILEGIVTAKRLRT
jgi:uncharacterized RDD family membrane protein YckC